MKYLYNFELFAIRMNEDSIDGYDEISQSAFNAFFETQSTNAGAGLYYRKNGKSIELVRRNDGEEAIAVANLKDIVWLDGAYLPPRPSNAYEWDGSAWVLDDEIEAELLTKLKVELCDSIDREAIKVGDYQVKSSPYLTTEYQINVKEAQAWKDAGFVGDAPRSVVDGALSHGTTNIEEAELMLRANANAEALIAELRHWRMSAKGVNGINGAVTAEQAQQTHDEALVELGQMVRDIFEGRAVY